MDFSVDGLEVGTHASEVKLARAGTVHARVKVSAYLPAAANGDTRNEEPLWMIPLGNAGGRHMVNLGSSADIQDRPIDTEPYWHIERARIKGTRQVPVELVMNGKPVAHKNIVADGTVQDIGFDVLVEHSSWMATRILGSSHSNPIFVMVAGKPIRASRQSAQWCLAAVDQCWTQKAPKISQRELPEARAAYDHARAIYSERLIESAQ
jgi:hypothetical protein